MPDVLQRLRALEAQSDVRETVARNIALCDVPEHALDGESLGALVCGDAVGEGIGLHHADKFGRLHGPHGILAMLQRKLPPTQRFLRHAAQSAR